MAAPVLRDKIYEAERLTDTKLDPQVGTLGDYGGPTDTISLSVGSPAIDRADAARPLRDQRNFARNGQPDIGAFEFEGTAPPDATTANGFAEKGN